MRSIILALLLAAALFAGFSEHRQALAAGVAAPGHAPAAAQVAPADPAPSPTPRRRRDEPPPPSVIARTQPTLRLAGVVGIGSVLLILLASLVLHRRHQARTAQLH